MLSGEVGGVEVKIFIIFSFKTSFVVDEFKPPFSIGVNFIGTDSLPILSFVYFK